MILISTLNFRNMFFRHYENGELVIHNLLPDTVKIKALFRENKLK